MIQGLGVEFYSSEDPGPFGIPSVEKISEYSEDLRNWDPTDDNESNPWIKYKQDLQEKEENQKKYYYAALQATVDIINICI